MKHLSLKLRISLLFTAVVAAVSFLLLLVAAEAYWNSLEFSLQSDLVDQVEERAFFLQGDYFFINALENDSLQDRDFMIDDTRILIYDKDGNHLGGMFLDNELDDLPYNRSEEPASITIDGRKYYYYDKWVFVRWKSDIWIRGVVRAEHSLWEVLQAYPWIWILVPGFLILAFAAGYLVTDRFLRPIKDIDATAEWVRQSGDLSTRIQIPEGKDEISALAGHINGMLEKLEGNFEQQKQFASNVSHELRTPVSVILAQCEYALDNASGEADLTDTVAAIQKQGYKMSGLIEGLLLFTRISKNSDKYKKEETDVSSLILSSCEDFNLIADRNIQVVANVPEGITAFVNRDLFSLMVNNLIQNGIRYGKENGHVTVTLQQEISHSSAVLPHDYNKIILTVADDGEGIPPEDLPHIWELFYRGDKSRSSKGTGLGLPLVQQIVRYHNGKITVESEPGEGTTFRIRM